MTVILHFIITVEPQKGDSGLVCSPPVRGDVWTSVGVWGALPLWDTAHSLSPCYIWSPPGRCCRRLRAERPQKALSSLKSSWTNRKANLNQSINWWNNLKLWEALGEGKCLRIMCNNCSLHFWFPHPCVFFCNFVFFPFLLKHNVEMFAPSACPRWANRVNSSPHAANHCVFSMYPVWTPRWTQITSIQPLCKNGSDWDHMNAPSTSSDHIKTLLIIRSCAFTAPSVRSCGGLFFNSSTSIDPHL